VCVCVVSWLVSFLIIGNECVCTNLKRCNYSNCNLMKLNRCVLFWLAYRAVPCWTAPCIINSRLIEIPCERLQLLKYAALYDQVVIFKGIWHMQGQESARHWRVATFSSLISILELVRYRMFERLPVSLLRRTSRQHNFVSYDFRIVAQL
jgi:hypothetical protein